MSWKDVTLQPVVGFLPSDTRVLGSEPGFERLGNFECSKSCGMLPHILAPPPSYQIGIRVHQDKGF